MASTTEVWTRQSSVVEDWAVAFTGTTAVGEAAGLATVQGVGEFSLSSLGVGLASGSAVVSGVGRATARGVGDADGSATVLGVGFATGVSGAVGLAAGVATVTAVGSESNDGVGLAQGAATVSGVGESTAEAVGLAQGMSTDAGVGASIADAAGTADGVATAVAAGADGAATIILEAFTGPVFETDASDRILTLTYPGGIEANDVLLVPLVSDWADGWVNVDGFTPLQTNDSDPTHAVRMQIWGKVAAGTETGTTDFTFNSSIVSVMGGAILRISGVDVSGGIAGIEDAATVGNRSVSAPDTSPIGSSITTATDGAMVLYLEANDGSVSSGSGAPATAVYDADTTLGNDIGMALSYKIQATAGASGVATFTLESAEDWVVTTMALKPIGPVEAAGASSGSATAAAVGEDANAIPAVVYDGVQGYMLHTSGPSGVSDGAALTFAWAGTFNSDDSAMTLLDIPGTVPVKLTRNADNTIDFVGGTAGAVFSNSTAAVAASVGFCIVLASCNGTTSHLYVIHATGLITGTNTAGSATNLDLTANWYLGADGGAAEFLDADTALWWIDDSFIDFSDSDNREEFWDTTNDLLRNPGATGTNQTGSQPLVCHKNAAATHTSNVGSGGDADTAGLFTDGTSPGTYADDFVPTADLEITETDTDIITSNTSSYDHTNISFGAEDAGRFIVVEAYCEHGVAVPSLSSMTIGGVSATIAAQANTSSENGVAIGIAAVPTGATGTVNVTWSSTAFCNGIRVHRVLGIGSVTPDDTLDSVTGTTLSGTITVPAGGLLIAAAALATTGDTPAWTGVTKSGSDINPENRMTGSSGTSTVASGDTTVTCTPDAPVTGDCMCAAAWAPA